MISESRGPGPGRRRAAVRGFTLIELIITVTVIAILAAIAIPNILAARLRANETATITVIRNLCTAQAQFRYCARADEDGDSAGEYGTFGELTGQVPVRGTTYAASQLSRSMAQVDANGEVKRNGYAYRMYLPGPGGVGVREQAGGGLAPGLVDPDIGEVVWCCYAYPVQRGSTGTRTFLVNVQATMLQADVESYTGANCAVLKAGAAFAGTNPDVIDGNLAIGATGADGNLWTQVQ